VTQRAPSAGTWLLGATAVAGGIGYVMQLLAGFHLDAAAYERFGVFWAAMFFVAGTISGIQQEIARGARVGATGGASPLRAGLVLSAGIAVVAIAVAALLPQLAIEALVIGVGAIGGAALAIVSGLSYGAASWSTVAGIMVVEAGVRLVLLESALLLGAPFPAVALAIALPWGITAALLSPRVRARASEVRLDVGAGGLAAIVSGFPFFMRASAPDAEAAAFGAFAFAFTLSRAPLVVVFIALQSFLIKLFQQQRAAVTGRLVGALAGLVAVTLIAAAVVAAAGPWAQRTFFGEDYVLASSTLFWIVASAAPLAIMCVTGPLALALNRHGAFMAGWVVASAASLSLLALPLSLEAASIVAIAVGPAVGAAVHVVGIARRRSAGR
jgi:hypothetical protein